MKEKKYLKKYILLVCILVSLYIMLYITYNYPKFNLVNYILAFETAESSINTEDEQDLDENSGDMVDLLARLINGEARGESYEGQVAVGAVVLNRVRDAEFPDTISGVIYQKGQFSSITDGQFDKPLEENSTVYEAAREALNGSDPTNGAIYFYNPKTAKSSWLYTRETLVTIGSHVFAK